MTGYIYITYYQKKNCLIFKKFKLKKILVSIFSFNFRCFQREKRHMISAHTYKGFCENSPNSLDFI
jgi:hypothetical protein